MHDSGPNDPFDPEAMALRARISVLREEHRALDDEVVDIVQTNGDQIRLARLKKRKLALKDAIRSLEDQLFPDIIA